jgi:beta-lactamase regulating signal transducer with metallopeptidase domain
VSLDFIAEMAWKSLVISAAALLLLALLRSRSAADRATVLRLAVLLLLALPLLSVALPALVVEEPRPPAVLQPILPPPTGPAADGAAPRALPAPVAAVPAVEVGDLVRAVYLLGLSLILARLAAGLWTLRRWTRRAQPVHDPAWRAALVRAGGFRVRLAVSDRAPSPMSWGLRRPVILIDRASLARPEDADAILAHEMAHVTRKDWPALMLSRLAVALFWFNPLVWVLERCLVQHAEEAADLQAVVRVEPVGYARTLLGCVRSTGLVAAPANGMAPGQGLARRLGAILDPRQRGLPSGSVWTLTAMAACVAVAAPIAAVELTPAAILATPVEATPRLRAPAPDQDEATARAVGRFASALEARAADRSRQRARRPGEVLPAPGAAPVRVEAMRRPAQAKAEAARAPAETEQARIEPRPVPSTAPGIIRTAAALTLEQAIRLRTLGVDTDQVEALAALGYRDLTTEQLVAMHLFRVTPDFIAELASLGYRQLTPEQLIELRVQRITPAVIRQWAALGFTGLTPDQLVGMRLRQYQPSTAEEQVALRVIGGAAIHPTSAIGPSPEVLVRMRLSRNL